MDPPAAASDSVTLLDYLYGTYGPAAQQALCDAGMLPEAAFSPAFAVGRPELRSMLEAAAEALQVSLPELGRNLGRFLVSWANAEGREQELRAVGRTFGHFVRCMRAVMRLLDVPSPLVESTFQVTEETAASLLLTIAPPLASPTSANASADLDKTVGAEAAAACTSTATTADATAASGTSAVASPSQASLSQPCPLCEAWFQGFIAEAATQIFGIQVQVTPVAAGKDGRLPLQQSPRETGAEAAQGWAEQQAIGQPGSPLGVLSLDLVSAAALGIAMHAQPGSPQPVYEAPAAATAKPPAMQFRVTGRQLWKEAHGWSPSAVSAAGHMAPEIGHGCGADAPQPQQSTSERNVDAGAAAAAALVLPLAALSHTFPFHVLVDAASLRVVQAGVALARLAPQLLHPDAQADQALQLLEPDKDSWQGLISSVGRLPAAKEEPPPAGGAPTVFPFVQEGLHACSVSTDSVQAAAAMAVECSSRMTMTVSTSHAEEDHAAITDRTQALINNTATHARAPLEDGVPVKLCVAPAAATGSTSGLELSGVAVTVAQTGHHGVANGNLLLLLLSTIAPSAAQLRSAGLFLSDLGSHGAGVDAAVLSTLLGRERCRAEAAEAQVAVLRDAVEAALQEQDEQAGRPAPALVATGGAAAEPDTAPAELVLRLLDRLVLGEQVQALEALEARSTLLSSITSGAAWWRPPATNGSIGNPYGGPVSAPVLDGGGARAYAEDQEVVQALAHLVGADLHRLQEDDATWLLHEFAAGGGDRASVETPEALTDESIPRSVTSPELRQQPRLPMQLHGTRSMGHGSNGSVGAGGHFFARGSVASSAGGGLGGVDSSDVGRAMSGASSGDERTVRTDVILAARAPPAERPRSRSRSALMPNRGPAAGVAAGAGAYQAAASSSSPGRMSRHSFKVARSAPASPLTHAAAGTVASGGGDGTGPSGIGIGANADASAGSETEVRVSLSKDGGGPSFRQQLKKKAVTLVKEPSDGPEVPSGALDGPISPVTHEIAASGQALAPLGQALPATEGAAQRGLLSRLHRMLRGCFGHAGEPAVLRMQQYHPGDAPYATHCDEPLGSLPAGQTTEQITAATDASAAWQPPQVVRSVTFEQSVAVTTDATMPHTSVGGASPSPCGNALPAPESSMGSFVLSGSFPVAATPSRCKHQNSAATASSGAADSLTGPPRPGPQAAATSVSPAVVRQTGASASASPTQRALSPTCARPPPAAGHSSHPHGMTPASASPTAAPPVRRHPARGASFSPFSLTQPAVSAPQEEQSPSPPLAKVSVIKLSTSFGSRFTESGILSWGGGHPAAHSTTGNAIKAAIDSSASGTTAAATPLQPIFRMISRKSSTQATNWTSSQPGSASQSCELLTDAGGSPATPAASWRANVVSGGFRRSDGVPSSTQAQVALSAAGAQHVLTMLAEPSDHLHQALRGVDEWQYDSFQLNTASQGRPLSCLAFHLMSRMDLIKMFSLDKDKLVRFLVRIEQGYVEGIYHSRVHAADVLRSLHVLLTSGGVLSALSAAARAHQDKEYESVQGASSGGASALSGSPPARRMQQPGLAGGLEASKVFMFKLLTCYLAAIVHDFDHQGVTNDFLIRTAHPLAVLYNDCSPQENHHVAAAFQLLGKEQYNFLPHSRIGESGRRLHDHLRKEVIELVLSTDMKMHFSTMGLFGSKVLAARQQAQREAAGCNASQAGSTPNSREVSTFTPAPGAAPKAPGILRSRVAAIAKMASDRVDRVYSTDGVPVTGLTIATSGTVTPRKICSARMLFPPVSPSSVAAMVKRSDGGTEPGSATTISTFAAMRSAAARPGSGGFSAGFSEGGASFHCAASLSPQHGSVDASELSNRRSLPSTPLAGSEAHAQSESGGASPFAPPHRTRRASLLYLACSTQLHAKAAAEARCQPWDAETQMLVLKVCLKCADLGHLTSSTEVHKRWVGFLEEEMFRQGDRERALGHAISPLMDRTKGGVTKSQCGFFNLIALPMYSTFAEVFPGAMPVHDNLKANYAMWNELETKHSP